MLCEYCRYKNSWDCADGWNRRKNCDDFTLMWDWLSDEQKRAIVAILNVMEGIR